jgi:hypothetical protein
VLDLIVIYCDDQSYAKLSKNLMFHDRSKNIDIKNYFIHDKVQREKWFSSISPQMRR